MDDVAFRSTLRAFVASRISPRIEAWERAGSYPAELHAEAGAARLLSLGGTAGSLLPDRSERSRMLIEELTRGGSQGLTMGLASHFVSLAIVSACAETEFAARITVDVLSGRRLIALALTEPNAGSDLSALETRAVSTNDKDWRIDGEKKFICNGARADYLVVGARMSEGLGLFLIERPQAEITSITLDSVGWRCLPLGALRLSNAHGRMIADPGRAGRLLRDALTRERLNLAIMAVTSAESVLEELMPHCQKRVIRRSPLIAMTHVRQTLAELSCAISVARDFVNRTKVEDGEVRVAMAKNVAASTLAQTARAAVQLHGAAGCIAPTLAERMFRDAPLVAIGGGTTEVMNEIIARSFEKERPREGDPEPCPAQ